MKSVTDLLNDLAEELRAIPWTHADNHLVRAQQLVGQIRYLLKEEQWKPR